jgi:ubiquinol-cytochrome c reductase iron-sulfur subunit
MSKKVENKTEVAPEGDSCACRREFLADVTVGFAAIGAACAATPFVKSMNPAANVLAEKTLDVDLTEIEAGAGKVVLWQGKPVFVRHRTDNEIAHARKENTSKELLDPADDEARVQNPKWLVTMAVCTHLGCVPMDGGDFGGWLCPCHGSQFDVSGRLRKGPAATNLEIPPYTFLDDDTLRIG